MTTRIFIDSGAFTHYNQFIKKTKKRIGEKDFSYTQSEEYKEYRDEYIRFLRRYGSKVTIYCNLDVIGDPEATYENQKHLEAAGLGPLPVWHLGEDLNWLEYYVNEYEYICIGGLVGKSAALLRKQLDKIWRTILTDTNGMPIVKVHGFGMTSFLLMLRYPWYSVDSKTALDCSSFGGLYIMPSIGQVPFHVDVTNLTLNSPRHYRVINHIYRKDFFRTLEEVDVPLGESETHEQPECYELQDDECWLRKPKGKKKGLVEKTIVRGVINDYRLRECVCLHTFNKFEKALPAYPWRLPDYVKARQGLLE